MDKSGPKAGGVTGSTGSAKNSMTPGFQGGAGGGEKTAGLSASSASARNEKGAATLGAGEAVAAGAVSSDSDASEDLLDETREGEENVNYTGGGVEDSEDDGDENWFFHGKGPVVTILGLIFGFIVLVFSSQVSQPFSLLEQLSSTFNTMQVSTSLRSNSMLKYQLDNNLMKSPYEEGLFSSGGFKISKSQKAKLEQNGITVRELSDEKTSVMEYTDPNTKQKKIIVANDGDISKVKSLGGYGDDVTIDSFRNAFETDSDFFAAYKGASMTWRGQIANWFGDATIKFLVENKITRNMFKTYKEDLAENGGDAQKTVYETMDNNMRNEIPDGGAKVATIDEETDDDGNVKTDKNGKTVYKYETDADGNAKVDKNGNPIVKFKTDNEVSGAGVRKARYASVAEVRAEMEEINAKYKGDTGSGISGAAQQISNYACLAFNFLGGVNLLVTAAESVQMITLAAAFMESASKAKAGDSEGSINEIMNNLNKVSTAVIDTLALNPVHRAHEVIGDIIASAANAGSENDFNNLAQAAEDTLSPTQVKITGSAMDSEGVSSLYSGKKINPDNASIQSFNFSRSIGTIMGGLGSSAASFMGCSAAKIAANAAGVVETAIEVGSCIAGAATASFTFGATLLACLPEAASIASGVAVSIAAAALINVFIGVLTPVVGGWLTRDLLSSVGVQLGDATWGGFAKIAGGTHQENGGSLLNKEKFLAFKEGQDEVIAEEAKYDRLTRSPFDAGSQYTFLGTLVRQMGLMLKSSSVMSAITNSGTTIMSAISKISPTALAIDEASMVYDNYDEICPYLDSIGAVGSAICEPYRGTDVSTMGEDPAGIVETLKNDGNFTEELKDGNVQIAEDSELAKYIINGVSRTSAFGIVDQNIVNNVTSNTSVNTESGTFNNTANAAIGAIPMVGDTIDVISNSEALINVGYVTGAVLVAGNDGSGIGTAAPDWDKAKEYQRFIEDQSLMESMGMITESAVVAFLDDYYEKNPLDNSYEGILARYSGLEKEDVMALLDVIDYYNYIANYNPSERYAFSQEVKPEGTDELKFDNDQKVAYVVLLNTIEFADVRNRNFVV